MSTTQKQASKFDKLPKRPHKASIERSDDKTVKKLLTTINEEQEQTKPIDMTAAEIIVDKELDEEEKRRRLLSQWGKKGAEASKKSTTKWKPQFIDIARKLAVIGVTEADIAALFGVDRRTFSGWKRRHQGLKTALKEGDSQKRTNLIMQMQQSAFNGIFQMQIFLAKNWLGMTDRIDQRTTGGIDITYKSHIPKETGAPTVDPESKKGKTTKIQDKE